MDIGPWESIQACNIPDDHNRSKDFSFSSKVPTGNLQVKDFR